MNKVEILNDINDESHLRYGRLIQLGSVNDNEICILALKVGTDDFYVVSLHNAAHTWDLSAESIEKAIKEGSLKLLPLGSEIKIISR